MAAGNFTPYYSAKTDILSGVHNLSSETIVAVLLGAGYTPSTAHSTWADVSAQELATGGGYTQGGVALTGESVSLSGAVASWIATGQPSWSSATITAKYCVLVKRVGGALASTDRLIGYVDLNSGGTTVSSTNGTFSVTIGANTILTLT